MTASCHTATPFAIDTDPAELADLQRRIRDTRWPEVLFGSGWEHGAAFDYVQELADYWRTSFDWRAQEAALNLLPHYTMVIDDQRLHYLHVRSPEAEALPLLLVHGWPGSFVEFLDVIELLSAPAGGPAFHLVIPSIPGFAFSTPIGVPGWTTPRIARTFAALMQRLGYGRYGVQGGDWGARIAPDVGRVAPDSVVGVHVNAATLGFIPLEPLDDGELDAVDRDRVSRLRAFRSSGSAYFQLQASTPQTLAFALSDSPAGLLAWVAEKFHIWSHDPSRIDRDRLLTNVTLHWLCRTACSAALLYYEHAHADVWLPRSQVPTGVAVFAEDLAIRRCAERCNTVVHWSEFDRGGHFAALEEPELLAGDIQTFFSQRSTS